MTSAGNAAKGTAGREGRGAVGNLLSRKCERATHWGRPQVTSAGIKGGRARAAAGGFETRMGGQKVTFEGAASGGARRGWGVRRKINPKGIARKTGRMAKEWEIISATCSSRLRCRRVAKNFCSWPDYSPSSAPQGVRRRRLPEMKDMPTQCVRGDFGRNTPEICTPSFEAPQFPKRCLKHSWPREETRAASYLRFRRDCTC